MPSVIVPSVVMRLLTQMDFAITFNLFIRIGVAVVVFTLYTETNMITVLSIILKE